jgi:hypothetical protein
MIVPIRFLKNVFTLRNQCIYALVLFESTAVMNGSSYNAYKVKMLSKEV